MKIKIRDALVIVLVLFIALSSYTLPIITSDIYDDFTQNISTQIPINYDNLNLNIDNIMPVTTSLTKIVNCYKYGEKIPLLEAPVNEKPLIVLTELINKEIDFFMELNHIDRGLEYTMTLPPTPFLYELYENSILVWGYQLVNSENDIINVIFHSGINKILSFSYASNTNSSLSEEQNIDFTNAVFNYIFNDDDFIQPYGVDEFLQDEEYFYMRKQHIFYESDINYFKFGIKQ